jgi:oligopeptidase A
MSEELIHNPLLERQFRIPFDRIEATHVVPAIEALLEKAKSELSEVIEAPAPRTYANTLGALEKVGESLEYAMGIVGHLESVMTSDPLREAYETIQPQVAAFYAGIALNPQLWAAIKEFAASDEARELDATRTRLLEKSMDSFRRHGADLPPDQKTRLEEIEVDLAQTTMKFSQNVVDSTAAYELVVTEESKLAGLPESALAAASQSAKAAGVEGWRFTLQQPSVVPLLTYLDDREIRRDVWRAYTTRASSGELDNAELIGRVLRLRHEKAKMLGYKSFADLVLEDRMAHDGATARNFVRDLETRSKAHFAREAAELLAFRREIEGPEADELEPWDMGYWAEKQRRALFDFDEEALRPYFPLDGVLAGLFELVQRLYGIRVAPLEDQPSWHPSTHTHAVYDGDKMLGGFYIDFFPRESKRPGAWMNGLLTGSAVGGEPHLGLICGNLTEPIGDRPALLTHREVETIFHEFGHLLHHLLSRVEIKSMAGTNVAWDFVELPSQIMENWCWERESLDLFARHHETGERIPDELFEKMKRARTFRGASSMMRQLGFATLDLELHVDFDPDGDEDVLERARAIARRFTTADLPTDYAMLCSFNHLFSSPVAYAAGYYSYKWAEVLDADAFTAFKSAGVFSREVGERFRTCILERGDSRDPQELYRDFMGRDPDLQALLQRSGLAVEGASS